MYVSEEAGRRDGNGQVTQLAGARRPRGRQTRPEGRQLDTAGSLSSSLGGFGSLNHTLGNGAIRTPHWMEGGQAGQRMRGYLPVELPSFPHFHLAIPVTYRPWYLPT